MPHLPHLTLSHACCTADCRLGSWGNSGACDTTEHHNSVGSGLGRTYAQAQVSTVLTPAMNGGASCLVVANQHYGLNAGCFATGSGSTISGHYVQPGKWVPDSCFRTVTCDPLASKWVDAVSGMSTPCQSVTSRGTSHSA